MLANGGAKVFIFATISQPPGGGSVSLNVEPADLHTNHLHPARKSSR